MIRYGSEELVGGGRKRGTRAEKHEKQRWQWSWEDEYAEWTTKWSIVGERIDLGVLYLISKARCPWADQEDFPQYLRAAARSQTKTSCWHIRTQSQFRWQLSRALVAANGAEKWWRNTSKGQCIESYAWRKVLWYPIHNSVSRNQTVSRFWRSSTRSRLDADVSRRFLFFLFCWLLLAHGVTVRRKVAVGGLIVGKPLAMRNPIYFPLEIWPCSCKLEMIVL